METRYGLTRIATRSALFAGRLIALCLFLAGMARMADGAGRTSAGLQVLYDFSSVDGGVVRDRSGVGESVDLKIENAGAARPIGGGLEVREKTVIRSEKAASKVIDAVRNSGEITIEAWVRPARENQAGPARIVTLSKNPNERNFTLGQDGDQFDVRLRTSRTSNNGMPSVRAKGRAVTTALAHVVYTRDRSGRVRLYVDGKLNREERVLGDLKNWDRSCRLGLANELTRDRPWLGSFHLVAIYNRGLSPGEVGEHFRAGASGWREAAPVVARVKGDSGGDEGAVRVRTGLQALYDFASANGAVVRDRSGMGKPMDLTISNPEAVRRFEGSMEVRGRTLIRTEGPALRLTEAIRRSGEFTLEAWVRPSKVAQAGPARIATLSRDSGQRNVTLGHDGDHFEVRFRTTGTSANGIPALTSAKGSLERKLTHVVYTRGRSGHARIYVNGRLSGERTVPGDTSNWNESFGLGLGNELSNDRPWLGTFYLVAVYNRDLSSGEVARNFRAGPSGATETLAGGRGNENAHLFESEIAPLISKHCLECHDSAVKKGGLDLSRKTAALAGGKSGKVIVPGKASESALWEAVDADEMPDDRPPLRAEEKQVLRRWIEGGASWPLETIDPVMYAHDRRAGENWVRRLTVSEYIETVRAAIGVDIETEARRLLPPDLRADGFNNTAYNLGIDLGHVEAYAKLAEIAVSRMNLRAFADRFSRNRKFTDDSMRGLAEKMGKWLLRGPLRGDEIDSFRGIATGVASAGGTADEAVGLMIEAMLQSPRFLYRVENQKGDGTAWPVGEYELASRLSYIVWGAPPDETLMKAAEAGELSSPGRIESQVRRMLGDPRAVKRSAEFVYQWLNLGRLDNLRPSRERFPDWDAALAADMREETLAFFHEVVWEQKRPLWDLLNAQFTYASPRLARHYGLKAAEGGGLRRYDLTSVPSRGGLLTQGSILTVGGDDASMVTRGLFLLPDLLRGVVKNPPPGLDVTPVPSSPGWSQRAIATKRLENKSCGGCHSRFEPLAFGLEKYDGLGGYHDEDEFGNVLRDDGEILFPGTGEPVAYRSSSELMNLLARSERVRESLTWKLTQFALGRPLVAEDRRSVEAIHEQTRKGGGTYESLIIAVATSDLVQTTRTESYE